MTTSIHVRKRTRVLLYELKLSKKYRMMSIMDIVDKVINEEYQKVKND